MALIAPISNEIVVSTTTNADQDHPSIAKLTNGRFIVAWADYSGTGGDPSISVKAQIFEKSGAKVGAEFLVNTVTQSTQTAPKVSALSSGGFVVTWYDLSGIGGDSDAYGIKGQVFNASGNKIGSEFLVNIVTAGTQTTQEVVPLASGGFVVSWADTSGIGGDADQHAVKARLFNASGAPLGGEILVNTTTVGNQWNSAIAPLSTGGFLVVWDDGLGSTDSNIKGQLFSATGVRIGGEFVVNATLPRDQVWPTIAALPSGQFVVAWEDLSGTGGDSSVTAIKAQIIDQSGNRIGGEILVNTSTDGWQQNVRIVALTTEFIVMWTDEKGQNSFSDHAVLKGQRFTLGGLKIDGEFVIASSTHTAQERQAIAALTAETFVAAWSDHSGASTDRGADVWLRIFSTDDGALFSEQADNVVFDDIEPGTVPLPVNSALGGDDIVRLPASGGGALSWGLAGGLFSGGGGNDHITAGAYSILIHGNEGDDTLVGGTGDSTLDGGPGKDVLKHNASGEDNSSDVLFGGIGNDRFVIADGDTVQDAEIGEHILLEGDLAGSLFYVTEADADGGHRVIRLEEVDGVLTEVAGARIVSAAPVRFSFTHGASGVELTVEPGSPDAVPDFTDALKSRGDAAIELKAEAFARLLAQEIGRQGAEQAGTQIFTALVVHVSGGVPMGFALRVVNAAGELVDRAFTISELVGGLTGFWISKFAGQFETQAEENAAFREALSPLIDPLISAIRIGRASYELIDAISGFVVGRAFELVSRAIDLYEAGVYSVADSQGRIIGSDADDVLVGQGDGNRLIGLGGNDRMIGTAGEDIVDYGSAPSGVLVDLRDGRGGQLDPTSPQLAPLSLAAALTVSPAPVGADSLEGIESAYGSAFADELNGDAVANTLEGGAGDDRLDGRAGDDRLAGGDGRDILTGGPGNDRLDGGVGADQLAGGLGNDVYILGEGDIVIEAADGGTDEVRTAYSDTVAAANVEKLTGLLDTGQTLRGNGLDNVIAGGAGADRMVGGLGNDVYLVGAGDNVIEKVGEGVDEVRTALAAYTLTAEVENLTGTSAGGQILTGNSANNVVNAGGGNDVFQLWVGGGNDIVNAGAGNDNIFFGATLTAADVVNGGGGVDTLVVQGPYGSLTLTANVTQIENVSILGGNNTNFGEPGTNRYDYVLTTHDANFAAGVQARINGAALLEGEDFTFNGSAETNASFVVYGGKGRDTLLGGLGNDIFFYAEERFASGDTVNGGAGYDGMFLRGNYTIDFNASGYTGLFTNIENLTLTSATDERYARGGGTEFDYNLTLSNAIVNAGQTLTVSGALLMASETMILDASQETDGFLRLFGGRAADTLKGGALADLFHGAMGADTLRGGGGADVFRYQAVTESNSLGRDHILDFTPGTDKIDLGAIDASRSIGGDQAFTWIGSNAFSKTAGELRATQVGGQWIVEGDINGDGYSDLIIALTLQGPTPLGAGDFLL